MLDGRENKYKSETNIVHCSAEYKQVKSSSRASVRADGRPSKSGSWAVSLAGRFLRHPIRPLCGHPSASGWSLLVFRPVFTANLKFTSLILVSVVIVATFR